MTFHTHTTVQIRATNFAFTSLYLCTGKSWRCPNFLGFCIVQTRLYFQLMTLAEYSRPNRVGYANQAANTSAPVKVSFVAGSASSSSDHGPETGEKIAFNYGRELFVYPYKGTL